jgi:hypothetical protein
VEAAWVTTTLYARKIVPSADEGHSIATSQSTHSHSIHDHDHSSTDQDDDVEFSQGSSHRVVEVSFNRAELSIDRKKRLEALLSRVCTQGVIHGSEALYARTAAYVAVEEYLWRYLDSDQTGVFRDIAQPSPHHENDSQERSFHDHRLSVLDRLNMMLFSLFRVLNEATNTWVEPVSSAEHTAVAEWTSRALTQLRAWTRLLAAAALRTNAARTRCVLFGLVMGFPGMSLPTDDARDTSWTVPLVQFLPCDAVGTCRVQSAALLDHSQLQTTIAMLRVLVHPRNAPTSAEGDAAAGEILTQRGLCEADVLSLLDQLPHAQVFDMLAQVSVLRNNDIIKINVKTFLMRGITK